MLLRAILSAVFAGSVVIGGAAPAAAEPTPVMCDFTLSPPSVVDVSGTPMVTASITPGACTGVAKPTFTQVCLSAAGSSTAGRCAELPGYNAARVYLSPYVPGVAYTARGRGCAAQTSPPAPICTTVGPTTVTL
ncbi:MAG: hypothetical protein U0Q20_00065 [Mycobacterium sp.]|nr:hypothetical protein [Mycobacterium sp.]